MRPEFERLADELERVRAAVAAVEETARPATNGWTVAQVLEHLAKTHRAVMPGFEEALASAPDRTGDESIRYSFLERGIIRGMAGRLPFKIPVPPMFEPGSAGPEAKAACLASIDGLLDLVRRADAKAIAGVRVASPESRLIRMGFLPYLDAMVAHARYHCGQI